MHALISTLAAIVLLAAFAPQKQIVWTFDRLDTIGGLKATVEGEPRIVDTPLGKAIEFDGVDDAVFIDEHPLAGAATFTFEAIFRPDGGEFAQRWFHLAERDPSTGLLASADHPTTGQDANPRILFELRATGEQWYLDAWTAGPGYSRALMFKDKVHPIGQWYHVAQTYDGKTYRSYVNGVLQGEAEIAFKPQGAGATSVGTRINRRSYFKGAVRQARFTHRALTPEEFMMRGLSPPQVALTVDPFLETLERRTFEWFWHTTNATNGLVPDRWPDINFSSIAAIGFGLTAYGVGAERGYVTRDQARDRTLTTLRFLWNAPQGDAPRAVTGYRGLFYHFLDMEKGLRYQTVELSTIDTALMMGGVLFAQSYFDRADAAENEIRDLAERLYRRAEWNWLQPRPPLIAMGWHPEKGMIPHDYKGYEEAMILYVLALGSPTHPISPDAWKARLGNYKWDTFYGQQFVNYAPLFIHQYSHIWIDFRGIQDAYMREKGIDYFENSRRATYAQRAYGARNPNAFRDYGENIWGLTACIGPADAKGTVDGKEIQFHTYWARGASAGDVRDDGTIAPTAAAGSLPFAPEIVLPALKAMHERYGERVFRRYGFIDAFNPTFPASGLKPRRGTNHPDGWFVDDYLGIDQGPIVLMAANHRSGLVWHVMKRNPHIVRGLCRAGFTGGWLEGRCQ